MSKSLLNLYDVLEEEYKSLHGEPAPSFNPHDPPEKRLKSIIKDIHEQQHSAICLSGGGIRSATFGLGVLQGLAHNGLLNKFSYLSTVSGGGYVGGWLSAWIHRHPKGVTGVAEELPGENSKFLLRPEPEPITHLRSYSNYLTPRLGLLSADTWTLVAIIGRNLILNWLVLIPLMVAALAVPRLFVSFAQLSPPDSLRIIALVLGFAGSVMMIVYVAIKRPSIAKRPNTQSDFIKWCLVPLLVSATLLALYWAWVSHADNSDLEKALTLHLFDRRHPSIPFIIFGVLVHVVGWLIYSVLLRRFKGWAWVELFALIFNGVVGGVLLWLVTTKTLLHLTMIQAHSFRVPALLAYAAFAVPIYLILVLLALTLFAGVSSGWTEDEDREWWARFGGWVLIAVVVWALASVLVLIGPPLTKYLWAKYVMPAGGLIGLVTALLGRSAKSPAKEKSAKAGLGAIIKRNVLPLGALIFAGVLIVFLSIGTNYLLALISMFLNWLLPHFSFVTDWVHNQTLDIEGKASLLSQTEVTSMASRLVFASAREVLILIGLMGVLGMFMAYLINTNKFSHHAMYRNRLIRAYLGASRTNAERHPNLFTGFDPKDNLPMKDLKQQPLHVVNMTLNLVHGDRLAWQERKAESFTVSPLHCGSFQIPEAEDRSEPVYGSYRRTGEYAGKPLGKPQNDGITLGTAVAISGAAVSPNMGYYSSPVVTFLMTLFNVRLGWWLGNPGPPGKDYYKLAYPKSAVYPIIAEALGLTDDQNSYVYLSDGGHFENLGLYEMVLRRCRLIVISDASDDAEFQFDNLGNAVQKVRTDFGIPIDFQPMQIFPRKDKKDKGAYCAIGTIRYSCVDEVDPADDGTIIYVKPVFYGDEPRDIYHYAMTHETFPHETTGDQWFSESQFESYRKLGSHIIDTIYKGTSDGAIGGAELDDAELSKFLKHAQLRAQKDNR